MPASVPHILVLDDDPAICEALTAAFKGVYVVHGAATGDDGCAVLRRHPIAGIVLDAMLGHEHGLDLVERFRTISQAPILVLTGYGSEDLAVRALRAKASEYLKKPVNLAELRTALGRLIHQAGPPLDPVARVRNHLREHLERPHTTESLTRDAGVSERHLRRRFRETYGKTPQQHLTELRLQRAAKLLRTTRVAIEQVAQSVGYPSMKTFSRAFKRAYGATPSQFRAGRGKP